MRFNAPNSSLKTQKMTTDLIGFTAALLTTAAFVPQAWQSWKTRNLSGISLPMYALFTTGVALWMLYGVHIGSAPVILANAVTFALAALVLWLKIQSVLPIKK